MAPSIPCGAEVAAPRVDQLHGWWSREFFATARLTASYTTPTELVEPRARKGGFDGTQSAGRGRRRARHRDPGRRGVDRRDVRGLLTVSSPVNEAVAFDPNLSWRLHHQVAVRPEPFGALLYHFGTRKLSFLKNRTIVAVVQSLCEHVDARSACRAAGIDKADQAPYLHALGVLAASGMLIPGTSQ